MIEHIVLPEASEEVAEAFRWYESRSLGLGRRFVDAVAEVVARACETPLAFPVAQHGTRSARVFSFPYSVYFAVEGDLLVVYAVFHERRNPAARFGRNR